MIREEHIDPLKIRNTTHLSMASPLLVVEIVNPGEVRRNRNYVAKRTQCEDLDVPEYWVVAPRQKLF